MTFFRRFTSAFRRVLGREKPAGLLSPIPSGAREPITNAPTTPYLEPGMRVSPPVGSRRLGPVESTDPFALEAPTISGDGEPVPSGETEPVSLVPAGPRPRPAPPHDPLAEYDIRLKQGPGAGLWFNPGATPVAVALATGDLPLQRALDVVIRERMNVVDVGAGFGLCTLVAARRSNGGQVYAFEPLADIAALVERSCSLNGFSHVEVHRVALADRDGEARMQLSNRAGQSRLDVAGLPPDPAGVVSVPVATLDSIVAASVCPVPEVLVLDVQGAEGAVLRGGAGTLRTGRAIILARVQGTGPAIAKLLEPLGYDTFPLGGGESAVAVSVQHRWVMAFPRERHHLRLYFPALSNRSIVEVGRVL